MTGRGWVTALLSISLSAYVLATKYPNAPLDAIVLSISIGLVVGMLIGWSCYRGTSK